MPIPFHAFTFWEGNQLSILHYMTVYSLHRLNPTLPIRIYTTSLPKEEDTHDAPLVQWTTPEHSVTIQQTLTLADIVRICPEKITLVPVDFDAEYGLTRPSTISVVYKADFIRIVKLYEHGGMWFDFDILFIRAIPSELFAVDSPYGLLYHSYYETIPTGILFAEPQNRYVRMIYEMCMEKRTELTRGGTHDYQFIGPRLWQMILPLLRQDPSHTHQLETDTIYPYLYTFIGYLFDSPQNVVQPRTWGIHWYNGSNEAKHAINRLSQEPANPSRSVFEWYLLSLGFGTTVQFSIGKPSAP